MVEELEQIPKRPLLALVPFRRFHDLGESLVINIRAEKGVGLGAALDKRDLHHDSILIAILDLAVVEPPSERTVDEELGLVRSSHRPRWPGVAAATHYGSPGSVSPIKQAGPYRGLTKIRL
jgi:hypothetical protein